MRKIICEIAAPQLSWSPDRVFEWTKQVTQMLQMQKIHQVNLSEIIDEEREGKRCIDFHPKMESLQFATLLHEQSPNLELILCKISTHHPKKQFEEWVKKAYEKGIRKIVVVGAMQPDHSGESYNVTQAARFITRQYPQIEVGGIIIFSRPDEELRILDKMRNGITFFLSQIIFESANLKQVMLELQKLCRQQQRVLPDVYIGIAPAKSSRDIQFLRWLGVEFPSAIYSHLTSARSCLLIEEDAMEIVERVIDEVVEFAQLAEVPLGFNIEHVMYGNLGLAERLIAKVTNR